MPTPIEQHAEEKTENCESVRAAKRAKAIHDAAWWGVVLAELGRDRAEIGPEARVTAAYKLADMVAESVVRLGVVPPGTAFELEAMALETVTPIQPANNVVINIAAGTEPGALAELVLAQLGRLDRRGSPFGAGSEPGAEAQAMRAAVEGKTYGRLCSMLSAYVNETPEEQDAEMGAAEVLARLLTELREYRAAKAKA